MLTGDMYASAEDEIRTMLRFASDKSFRVLFYTGDFDMACGFLGTDQMLRHFDFRRVGGSRGAKRKTSARAKSWGDLERQVWVRAPHGTLGYVKSLKNLTQVTVVDAGHLVPMDRPRASRSMIEHWVFEEDFPVVQPDLTRRNGSSSKRVVVTRTR